MAGKLDNVVLTKAAAAALRREFLGWQCRLRQMAARESGGRPSSGMRPRVTTREGHEIAPGIVVLIVESEPAASTQLFRHQYMKTEDPNERYDKILEILQASYFQQPGLFSDVMTALFAAIDGGGPASEPWALRPGVRAICPGLPHSLRRRRAGPAPSLLPGHLLA